VKHQHQTEPFLEQGLIKPLRMLTSALDQSILATVLVDENDRVLYFNAAAENLWGIERAQILGRPMRPLLPKALQGVHHRYMHENRKGGQPRVVGMSRDVLLERQDGKTLWASFSLSKIDIRGRIHYLAFARDVSEEVARREENRLLLLAVNNTDRPIFVLDECQRIVQVNRAFAELFDCRVEEVIGRSPDAFFDNQAIDLKALESAREHGVNKLDFAEEMQAYCPGQEVWVRASINPIFNQSGQLVNQVVALSDVTEARQIRSLERDVLEALTGSLSFKALGDLLCQRIEAMAPGVLVALASLDVDRLRLWAGPSLQVSDDTDWLGMDPAFQASVACAAPNQAAKADALLAERLWTLPTHSLASGQARVCWRYPVKRRDGRLIGALTFYLQPGDEPDAKLRRIAQTSMHLCALAIEREASRQRLKQLAQFDALTGLPNRSQLHHYLDELLASADYQSMSVFYISLDRFKDINNTFGHAAGDQTLVEMANRFRKRLGNKQFLSRPEANLYVLIVPDCNGLRAATIAAHLQQVTTEPVEVSGFSLALSISIGITHHQKEEGKGDRDSLLQNAKSAMDQIKMSGGGDYLFFSEGMNRLARERLLLGTALRRAIPACLTLAYQPQIRLDTGALYGVEALARWHDAEFGWVPPDRFIGLAEEIGEIEAIGEWALREACWQLAAWRDQGLGVPMVSVNLSPLNFRNPGLPGFVARLLDDYCLTGQHLTIEITESAAMALTPEMLSVVQAIHALGVGLSVDDFGTGFSSLSNLANLPVSEVKIDRSFIAKCQEESRLQALVQAVIGIGKSLDLTVVAEGVETLEQSKMLMQHSCPVAQGYLYSRPLKPLDFGVWLRRRSFPD